MSFVITTPELVQGAAAQLAGVRSSLAEATAWASGPTTGILAAAQDEVSTTIASLFGDVGEQFQALSAQAQAFYTQFANLVNGSAGAYVSAEAANARVVAGVPSAVSTLTKAADDFGAQVAAPYQSLVSNTVTNAQTVFGALPQTFGDLFGGISKEFGLLFTNPTAAVNNLANAPQSVALIGNPDSLSFYNLVSAVAQHTLGVGAVTTPGIQFNGAPVKIADIHYQVWLGLNGDGFSPGTGLSGALYETLANFAASPLSGVLIGYLGPVVSPEVALFNEAGTIFADLTGATPNPAGALATLLGTPATVTNAFFNGATLNLDALDPIFNPFVNTGDQGGQTITGLSIAFGGLFSPGQVALGANDTTFNGFGGDGVGGSILNSLGMSFAFSPPDGDAGATVSFPGIPVGPIGATENLIDIVGQQLGGNLINEFDRVNYFNDIYDYDNT